MGLSKKGIEWLDNLLFNLLCCIAGDNISQSGTTDAITYHKKLANEVTLLHTNLTLRNCINENLLIHFNGGKIILFLSYQILSYIRSYQCRKIPPFAESYD